MRGGGGGRCVIDFAEFAPGSLPILILMPGSFECVWICPLTEMPDYQSGAFINAFLVIITGRRRHFVWYNIFAQNITRAVIIIHPAPCLLRRLPLSLMPRNTRGRGRERPQKRGK